MDSLQQSKEKMNDKEKLGIWKIKLIELEERLKRLNNDKNILVDILNELNKKANARLNGILQGINLQEEISYLNDWAEFYNGRIARYKDKIKISEKEISQKDALKSKVIEKKTKEEVKLLFEKRKPVFDITNLIKSNKKLITYGIPVLLSLLVVLTLFISKPGLTGYVTLTEEKVYSDNLNLRINESGNYTWYLDKPGKVSSVRATGSVVGNGTVNVYIEKDGKRYLVYKNR